MYERALTLLEPWVAASEAFFFAEAGVANTGYYGGGYNAWGVQTNQKYLSALAVYSAHARRSGSEQQLCDRALEKALMALRFSLRSHRGGGGSCADGTSWGHTWISTLGIERMMNGVWYLLEYLNSSEQDLLARVLQSEADWLATSYRRGAHEGVLGGLWAKDGKNDPESNIWNGSFLWRVSKMYPDSANVGLWQERALEFLATGITTEQDLLREEIWDGKPLKDRCKGPNFFPNYALDHHGYFNLGYMVICLSNIAIAHFDSRIWNYDTPELLHLHSGDLWKVVKKMIFQDGRLARIGGDTRVRYAYCQEFLIPTLLYAADYLEDPHALSLLERQLRTITEEQQANPDGSYYGSRLEWLRREDPVYYTRLESDRACALAMIPAYWEHMRIPVPRDDFEESVSGGWEEPQHGDVMHRSPERLAAFSWSSSQSGQGTLLPPNDGHLAEWEYNLTGRVTFLGEVKQKKSRLRDQSDCWIESFNGGFLTQGAFTEGLEVTLGEGWKGKELCHHQLAWCALPDGHSVVAIEYARTNAIRSWVRQAVGMHYNLPNDLFNGYSRRVQSQDQEWVLHAGNRYEGSQHVSGNRLLVEGRIGITGIYGGEGFRLFHPTERTGGSFHSLFTDVIAYGGKGDYFPAEPCEVVVDCAWAVECSTKPIDAKHFFDKTSPVRLAWNSEYARGIQIEGWDGRQYRLLANFSKEAIVIPEDLYPLNVRSIAGVSRGELLPAGQSVLLEMST